MKVYISGPMSVKPGLNSEEFNRTARILRKLGLEVVNPAGINSDADAAWLDCILEDPRHLSGCDAILLLDGWEDSYSAQIEWFAARKLGLTVWTSLSDVIEDLMGDPQ